MLHTSSSGRTKTSTKFHTIKRGDNLGEIAEKYDVSIADLRKWNKIRGNNIIAGHKLKIYKTTVIETPVKQEAIAAKETKAKEKVTAKTAVTTSTKTAVASTDDEDVADAEVADDMDVTECAKETKTAVAVKETTKRSKQVNYEEERMYIVQKGDSLFSIARKHPGVTVENLRSWNKIQGENIQPGMKLKVAVIN